MLKFSTVGVNYLKNAIFSSKVDLWSQQTRNTFILKRKYPLPLHKKSYKPRILKARNFVYDLVEDTNCKKKPLVDVILLETIEKYGIKGSIVSLHPEKAYNYLLLPKLAVYATPENIEKYYIERTKNEEDASSLTAQRTLTFLSSFYLTVMMSKHQPWTIEKWHIRVSFRKTGIYVPEDAITIPEQPISGPDLSIQNKEFYVTVTINNKEQIKVRCRIHHWTHDIQNQIQWVDQPWKIPSIAIFPEDQPIIDSLPKHSLLRNESTNVS